MRKRFPYDMPDLSGLPTGQRRAVNALIGDGVDWTYPEAARVAGMSEGTLLTHFNRVRRKHPELYAEIRVVRRAQLAIRHQRAMQNARFHSRAYLRRLNRFLYEQLGYTPW